MEYKVRKYSNLKKRNIFETYEPEPRVGLTKENAVPLFVRICNLFLVLGGMIGFFVSSLLVGMLGFFGVRRKVRNFGFNKRVVEIGVRNRKET